MTAKISQSVIPRHRKVYSFSHNLSEAGDWYVRPLRAQRSGFKVRAAWPLQQGSVTNSTMTIAISLLILSVVAFLGFFYLQQVFSTASQDTAIQTLQTKLNDLHQQQQTLELQGAKERTIQAVEDRVEKMKLEHIDSVSYLVPQGDQLASNVR